MTKAEQQRQEDYLQAKARMAHLSWLALRETPRWQEAAEKCAAVGAEVVAFRANQ